MSWFECKHPLESLVVEKEATTSVIDTDFKRVTYHFYCNKCSEEVKMSYATTVGGVEAFLNRKGNNEPKV